MEMLHQFCLESLSFHILTHAACEPLIKHIDFMQFLPEAFYMNLTECLWSVLN